MNELTEDLKQRIIKMIRENKLSSKEIADSLNLPVWTIRGIKAHYARGTYGESSLEAEESEEEIFDALEMTFGLERDLQRSLRCNIEQLEKGLSIIDEGKEKLTSAGRIDITAKDAGDNIVVIELKVGTADLPSVAQILSYMGALIEERKPTPIRGLLVAGDFDPRVIIAVKAVTNLKLIKYSFNFKFQELG